MKKNRKSRKRAWPKIRHCAIVYPVDALKGAKDESAPESA
jgi:hypothetical protein